MSQPSYIRASDVIYVIIISDAYAQTVDTRLSFSTRPRIRAWGRGYLASCPYTYATPYSGSGTVFLLLTHRVTHWTRAYICNSKTPAD